MDASESGIPKDGDTAAVLTFFALGIGSLLPWNSYITAVDYFEFLYPNKHIDRVLTVAYLLPALVVLLVLLIHDGGTSFRFRVNSGLCLLLSSTILIPVLDIVAIGGGEGRGSSLAFIMTVLGAGVAGCGDSVVSGTIIARAGELPFRYLQAILSGTAGCGVVVSLLRIITKGALPQDEWGLRVSANVYFTIGAMYIVCCSLAYNRIQKLPVMLHYETLKKDAVAGRGDGHILELESNSSTSLLLAEGKNQVTASNVETVYSRAKKLVDVFRSVRWLSASFLLLYIITLSIFPGFLAEDVHSTFLKDWYPVLLITSFNVFNLLGKSGTVIFTPKTQSATVIGSVARILFIPLFAACLHGPKAFRSEGPVFVLTSLLGFSNGYFTSTGFIEAPKLVAAQDIERAGVVMVLSLMLGLSLGSVAGWAWVV